MKVLFLLSTFATIALGEIQNATVCGICTPDGCMDDSYIEYGSNFGGHDPAACLTPLNLTNIGATEEDYKTSSAGIDAKEEEEAADAVAIAAEQTKIEAETDEDAKKALKFAAYKLIRERVVSKRKKQKTAKKNRDKFRGVLVVDTPDLKKERVKESRIKIAKTMLPFNADFKAKLKKEVAIAMSEEEAVYANECNSNDDSCCSYDIANDDVNTTTLLGLADSVGAWGVLCDGAELLSRQVRKTVHNSTTDSSEYMMSCWNGTEFSSEETHSTGGNYTCRSRTIMIGSQGVSDETNCNGTVLGGGATGVGTCLEEEAVGTQCTQVMTNGVCGPSTCGNGNVITYGTCTCSANKFDTNNDATDGCEAGCPSVDGGSCNTCSDKDTCTAVTCDANKFDTNNDAADGCEAGCPLVDGGTCNTCSDKDTCTAVTCAANKFNDDGIFNNGCEAGCPSVDGGTCNTCSDKDTCTAVTCTGNYLDTNNVAADGCEAVGTCTVETTDCAQLKACYNDPIECNGACGAKSEACEAYGTLYNTQCPC